MVENGQETSKLWLFKKKKKKKVAVLAFRKVVFVTFRAEIGSVNKTNRERVDRYEDLY